MITVTQTQPAVNSRPTSQPMHKGNPYSIKVVGTSKDNRRFFATYRTYIDDKVREYRAPHSHRITHIDHMVQYDYNDAPITFAEAKVWAQREALIRGTKDIFSPDGSGQYFIISSGATS